MPRRGHNCAGAFCRLVGELDHFDRPRECRRFDQVVVVSEEFRRQLLCERHVEGVSCGHVVPVRPRDT